jgi:hypothetical protein
MPLVVSDAERSTSTGSADVGTPNAIGSGVKTGFSPPCGATLADDTVRTLPRHASGLELGKVCREQRQPVRVVAEQVAFDEHIGHVACERFVHAHGREQ